VGDLPRHLTPRKHALRARDLADVVHRDDDAAPAASEAGERAAQLALIHRHLEIVLVGGAVDEIAHAAGDFGVDRLVEMRAGRQ